MAINLGIYNRPMTEEERRMMMAQTLRVNNQDNSIPTVPTTMSPFTQEIPEGVYVDPNSVNDVTGTMNQENLIPPRREVAPIGGSMTIDQIEEEIMRLQIMKNQMMTGN